MSYIVPMLFVVAAWWLGTGIVLYLQRRLEQPGASLALWLSVAGLSALMLLWEAAADHSHWHSYAGLVAATVLWGCIELSYYCGLIGGTHKNPCPESCTTRTRFRLALGASLWHELSVVATGLIVIALLWDAVNPTGLYCFLVFWLMRWSAKLNLFFGVPNFSTEWFPQRLAHLHGYIRRAPVSIFFPLSVGLALLVAWQLLYAPAGDQEDSVVRLSTILPGVLMLLAVLEHLFMALPIADTRLWNRLFVKDAQAR